MNVFNTETRLMSNPLNSTNLSNELKKQRDRYIQNDIYNVFLVSQAIPKFYISEWLKIGLSTQRGYNFAMAKRNVMDTMTSKNKWVLFDKKTGTTRSVNSNDLDEKSKKIILNRLNDIEQKKYRDFKLKNPKSKKPPPKIKKKLSVAMNRDNFLDIVSDEQIKGVKIINLGDDKSLILRKDAQDILGYTEQPKTSASEAPEAPEAEEEVQEEQKTPIVEEIDDK